MPNDDAPHRDQVQLARFFLKRGDQLTAVILTLLALAAMAVYWWRQGGFQGRLVEVERIPVRRAAFRVDINTADWPELAQIPEIGETLAKRIVAYRAAHGPFSTLEALLEVEGIGPRTYQQMLPFVEIPAQAPAETPSPIP